MIQVLQDIIDSLKPKKYWYRYDLDRKELFFDHEEDAHVLPTKYQQWLENNIEGKFEEDFKCPDYMHHGIVRAIIFQKKRDYVAFKMYFG